MKRFLPNIVRIVAIIILVQFLIGVALLHSPTVLAQATPTPTIAPTLTPTPTVPSSLQQNVASPNELPADWIIDPEVTSIGKNAARAGIFLDWALQNYDWSYVKLGNTNPLIPFWITLRNIVYALMILVVIAGSLVLIITRGKSVTLRRFIPRFLGVVLLVTFSFAFVEFLYAVVDVFQGFFIRPGNIPISQNDLLFIGWNYKDFVGLRALGGENFESAFISLLLVKLTSFTYYAMVGILLIRKIILWFFIMISPFFPLLLFFYPLRNTAKIWLGEFFRWLLYAPLFAIFLAGLVSLWRIGIPLSFDFTNAGKGFIVFPTAVSILLGGPLQKVGIANSVNLADTFGLYLVALLMLWMVIIFPFILLQIFLDYLSNINVNQNALARQLINFMTRPPSPSGGTPPPSSQPAGLARALPFLRDFIIPKVPTTTGLAREIPRSTQTQQQQQTQTFVSRPVSMMQKESIEKLTNISVPTLRDIVKFESISLQKDTNRLKEVARIREALQNIANPETTQMSVDRVRYSEIKDKLTEQSKSGNQVASSVLHAAQTVASSSVPVVQNITNITNLINKLTNPAVVTSTREREKYVEVRERLVREQEKNNTLATTVLSAMQAMTATSKNTLQTIVQTLAHPEDVSQKLKNTVIDLKETLKKESESGNQLAKTVLSVFEKLERVEKMSSNLLNIQQPGRVKDTKEKEHFEKIKETLIKERTNNNALATTILTQIAKLSTVSTTDEKTQVVQAVKEAITREHENNNELASFISTELPGIMQIEGDTTLGKMQGDLEKAKADGNPLAAKLLAIATETSSEKQKERLASLQTEIAKEKAKGNPLATTLSDMLYPKPKLASKPEAFPTINRIQEVSLDDYEAVKKMWVENYQNLETTGNIGDNVSKKEWIEDDIKQISGTIDLLTSQDAEKVEEGMQKVSDILPFLLIGGFSQSEIVAYLKAKQAAAKDVLVDIEKKVSEEDTEVMTTQRVSATPQTRAASEEVPDVASTLGEVVTPKVTVLPPAQKTVVTNLINIHIPTLADIARYESSSIRQDTKEQQETLRVKKELEKIANPKEIHSTTERERYTTIREKLVKESQSNTLASTILTAASAMTQASLIPLSQLLTTLVHPAMLPSAAEKQDFVSLRQELTKEQDNQNALATAILAAMQSFTTLSTQLLDALINVVINHQEMPEAQKRTVAALKSAVQTESVKGDKFATELLSLLTEREKEERVMTGIVHIMTPEKVTERTERERFEKIHKTLIEEKERKNTAAIKLLETMQIVASTQSSEEKMKAIQTLQQLLVTKEEKKDPVSQLLRQELPDLIRIESKSSLQSLQDALQDALSSGNTLAMRFLLLSTMLSSQKQTETLAKLQEDIIVAKQKGDPLAQKIADAMKPSSVQEGKAVQLPISNRIQEVSLDDYEAVKKMWTESYQQLASEEDPRSQATKTALLKDDISAIADTIDLLSFQDASKIEEGMQKVSDILPFLLIGGFSQSEIVAYLKAKQAAAKDVLTEIEKQNNDEDTKVTVEHQVAATPKTVSVSQSLSHEVDSYEPETPIVHIKETPRSAPVVLPAPKLLASDTASTQMLRLANISIPSIRTVASYDEALFSHDAVRSQDVEKIQLALRDIANPTAVSDQAARLRYIDIHDALEKESVRGNAVATSLVSAGRLMGRLTAEAVFAGVLRLRVVLMQLSDPALIKDGKEKESYTKLLETIRFQSQNGDAVASEILSAIEDKEKQSPVAVLSLRGKLLDAVASGNQLAGGLLGKASQVEGKSFSDTLKEITGMYLLIDMQNTQRSLFADESNDTARVLAEVKKYSETGNDLAKALLAVKDKNDYVSVLSLVESVDKGSDQFAKNLQVSLKRLSATTPLIQSTRPVIQQALAKVLSLLTNPLGAKAPQMTMLHEQLVDAKKSGSALASLVLEKADEKTKAEMKAVGQILSSIDNPESLSDAGEKASFRDMRLRLEKEKAKNNELADEILTVAHVLGSKTVSSLDKSTIAVMLWENLVQAKNEGDLTARRILEAADGLTLRERLGGFLSDAIISLSHPEAITDVTKKEQYLTLKKTIITESAKGNTLALQLAPLLDASGERLDPAILQTISAVLEEQAEKGSALARELLRLLKEEEQGDVSFAILHMLRGVSDPESAPLLEEQKEYRELRSQLQKAAQADNIVAMSILAGAERAKIQGDDLSEAKKLQELLAHDQSELSLSIHAFVDNEVEKYEDILMLRFLLHGMQHPDYVPDKTLREILEKLQKDLTVEAENGNSVAKQIEKTLGEISEPGVPVDQELRIVSELYGQLQKAKHDGNVRAEELISLIQAQHVRMQAGRLVSVMESIADPETARVVRDHDSYKSIKQTLVLERNKGNQFADFLLSLSQSFSAQRIKEEDMHAILALLYQRLIASEAEGNSFAMSILARLKLDAGTSKPPQIEAALLQAKEKDDPVAKAVFAVIDEEHGINRVADGVVLPSVNRIQEVSLDDYEAVRSMWEESYKTHDIPQLITGERPIREEWLRDDVERIQSIVALLTSVDQEKINEGMQEVSGILPFLLIGGFSLAEIIAYLKAKLQAAKTVLREVEKSEEALITVHAKEEQVKAQQEE